MIVLRNKSFSRLQDEDYYEKHNDRKKSVRHAKRNSALIGGALGGLTGANILRQGGASNKATLAAAAIGTGIGGVGGYYLGKKIKKDTEKDADKKMDRYRRASEMDKKYIREKEERDEMKELERRKALAQEQMAWNSWR